MPLWKGSTLQKKKRVDPFLGGRQNTSHYENMPIQIYWKFYHQTMNIFRQKILIFFIFLLKTDGSNEYQQSMFLSRNRKNNVYLCKPLFYYTKVTFRGVKIIEASYPDGQLPS